MILLDTLRLGSDSSDVEGKSTSHIGTARSADAPSGFAVFSALVPISETDSLAVST